ENQKTNTGILDRKRSSIPVLMYARALNNYGMQVFSRAYVLRFEIVEHATP
ncbi:MAG: hypothetical protein HY015_01960, partial [Bacteroidetes bacterium]|nr:hypothetical protein [Bacteroidota bacterium]